MIDMKVIEIYWHFVTDSGGVDGLYKIKINDRVVNVIRNGNSWGVLSHWFNEPVTKCINLIREDRIGLVEKAIEEYLKTKENGSFMRKLHKK